MTTTYLRAFTAEALARAKDACEGGLGEHHAPALAALKTPVNGEALAMPIVCTGWNTRAAALGLPKKGAKREQDREAYMQGAMAAMVALGVMTVERANQVAFLTAVGRLEDYMAKQAAQDVQQQDERAQAPTGTGFRAARHA